MAFQTWAIDRFKSSSFFDKVEWKVAQGVMVRVYEPNQRGERKVVFTGGTYDVDYDQRSDKWRQYFLTRRETVRFMLNIGFNTAKIVKLFKQLECNLSVTEMVE